MWSMWRRGVRTGRERYECRAELGEEEGSGRVGPVYYCGYDDDIGILNAYGATILVGEKINATRVPS